jgi:serine protease
MNRSALLVPLLSATCLLALSPQPAAQNSVRKERTHDIATPGALAPLRTVAVTRPFEPPQLPLELPQLWDVDPATGAQYRRGELLVRFKDGASQALRVQALQRRGATRRTRALPEHWELVAVARDGDIPGAAADLARDPAVQQVSMNYRLTTQQLRPNDTDYRLQWNFDSINMPQAWQINPGARNDVTVAVIDTGLNTLTDTFVFPSSFVGAVAIRFAAVPDLVTDGRIEGEYDFVYGDVYPVDLDGHGTHVAGTIAQQTNNNLGVAGIAYNVKLMPLKVLSGSWDLILNPGNDGNSTSMIAEAVRYAADSGAKVINMSLGGAGPAPIVRDALRYAVDKGAFVAIAAGNDGDVGNPVTYPAAYAEEIAGVMTVGAVNRGLQRAAYSGFHSYVEVCAPGGETQGDVDYEHGITQVGYEEISTLSFFTLPQQFAALQLGFRPRFDRFELRPFQGTSMATPHVSGVAALLYSQGIRNPAAIESAIKRFATSIDATAEECGAGLVDARRALRGLGLSR